MQSGVLAIHGDSPTAAAMTAAAVTARMSKAAAALTGSYAASTAVAAVGRRPAVQWVTPAVLHGQAGADGTLNV
jgi:hypothetical protein